MIMLKKYKNHKRQGFTIVELIIVIVVIAILAAITVVAYTGIQRQAEESVLKNNSQSMAKAIEAYKALKGAYPSALADIDSSAIGISPDAIHSFYSSGEAYCLSVKSKSTDMAYFVTNSDNSPRSGLCPQDTGPIVALLAGSGTLGFVNSTGEAAALASPTGITTGSGDTLYFTDASTSRIRAVTTAGVVTTIAGNGGSGTTEGVGNVALFNWPQALSIGFGGSLYVADTNNQRVRTVPLNSTATSTFAGLTTTSTTGAFADGTSSAARFNTLRGIAYDATNSYLYIADSQNNRIRRITSDQITSTLAGQSSGGFLDHATGTSARLNYPQGIAVGPGGIIYVADTNNHRIRTISPSGAVSTLAGSTSGNQDGSGANARFASPNAVAVTTNGVVYVADTGNHSIRKITPDGTVTTVAGNGSSGYSNGSGEDARFNTPRGITLGNDGRLYIADTMNHRIRVISNL